MCPHPPTGYKGLPYWGVRIKMTFRMQKMWTLKQLDFSKFPGGKFPLDPKRCSLLWGSHTTMQDPAYGPDIKVNIIVHVPDPGIASDT